MKIKRDIADIIVIAIGKNTLTKFAMKIEVPANHLYRIIKGGKTGKVTIPLIKKLVDGSDGRLNFREVVKDLKE